MTAPTLDDLPTCDDLAKQFAELTLNAGALVMDVYARADQGLRLKADASPVSDADEQAEDYLLEELARLFPDLPVIAEESAARGRIAAAGDRFILVDPLDGTREFIARRTEFTVNIGLIDAGVPRAGAIFAPALDALWFAGETAYSVAAKPGAALPAPGAWRRLTTRRAPDAGMTALVSRSHLDAETRAFIERHKITDSLSAGSSLKFCRIAEARADVYPRFGPTMEWDTAAGDAILRAAGGVTVSPGGAPFLYGKAAAGYRNGSFIAFGDRAASSLC
jgi:3'(2'), 5'-bisphosphate nucleotidase